MDTPPPVADLGEPHVPGTGSSQGRIARNWSVLLVADIVGRSLTMASAIVIARLLGPADFGYASLALTMVLAASVLSEGGMTVWTQRQIVLHPDKLSQHVTHAMTAQLAFATSVSIVILVIAEFGSVAPVTSELLLLGIPFLFAQVLNLNYAFVALERMKILAASKLAVAFVAGPIGIAGVWLTGSPSWMVNSLTIGSLIGSVVTLVSLVRRYRLRPKRIQLARLRELVCGGLPLLGAGIFGTYMFSIDVIVLGLLAPAHETGLYFAANRIVTISVIAILAMGNAIYAELVRREGVELDRFLTKLLEFAGRISAAGSILIAILSAPIIYVLYSSEYDGAAPLLALLALQFPGLLLASLLRYALTAKLASRTLVITDSAAAVVMTISLLIAVPQFGAIGAAAACLGTAIFRVTLAAIAVHRLIPGYWFERLSSEMAWAVGLAVVTLGPMLALNAGWLLGLVVWLVATTTIEAIRGAPTLALLGIRRSKQAAVRIPPE